MIELKNRVAAEAGQELELSECVWWWWHENAGLRMIAFEVREWPLKACGGGIIAV